jgi:hypothetical protein
MALLCKKITAVKSKEVKTGCNMAESSMALLCPRWVSFANDDDEHD